MHGSRRFLLAMLRRRHDLSARCRNGFHFNAHARKRALARHNPANSSTSAPVSTPISVYNVLLTFAAMKSFTR
ncbi:hypothetical protein [Acetobacter sp. UBA5411]|uniref:hypothetical protein n=1 Tax=Acetobacter sp. UBA5411 TaxID=1945905 RepID=UPI0025BABE8D|nr:hypothetical protein [Acetobacter sp. UBA5411]